MLALSDTDQLTEVFDDFLVELDRNDSCRTEELLTTFNDHQAVLCHARIHICLLQFDFEHMHEVIRHLHVRRCLVVQFPLSLYRWVILLNLERYEEANQVRNYLTEEPVYFILNILHVLLV